MLAAAQPESSMPINIKLILFAELQERRCCLNPPSLTEQYLSNVIGADLEFPAAADQAGLGLSPSTQPGEPSRAVGVHMREGQK